MLVLTSLAIALMLAPSFLPGSLLSSPFPLFVYGCHTFLILFLRRFKMLRLSDVMPDLQRQCRPTRLILLLFFSFDRLSGSWLQQWIDHFPCVVHVCVRARKGRMAPVGVSADAPPRCHVSVIITTSLEIGGKTQ